MGDDEPVHRRPILVALLVIVLLAGCTATAQTHRRGGGVDRERPVVGALAVLHRWDERRAAAYASGDVRALRRLYLRGSWAGARDARILREYADRGLVVDGVAPQVVRARLVERSGRVLRLRVLERLVRTTVRSDRSETSLPAGRLRDLVVTLVRERGRWRVCSVQPRDRPRNELGSQRSAAASRSVTSLCANA